MVALVAGANCAFRVQYPLANYLPALPHGRILPWKKRMPHGKSYFPGDFGPVDSEKKSHSLWGYHTLQSLSLQIRSLRNTRESEGPCSSAGSRGWPLASAERAASPSAEGWREFQREVRERIAMHGSLPLSENQETPTTISARNSGAEVCPFTTSSPHWSSKVTRSRARSLPRPLWRVRSCVGR